jgi:hypothetical protein
MGKAESSRPRVPHSYNNISDISRIRYMCMRRPAKSLIIQMQDDDKGLDDQVGFFPHQWEKGRLNPPGPEFHTRTTTSVTSAVFDTCACAVAPQPDNFRGASTTTDQDDDMDGGTAATGRTEPSWCMIYVS